MISKQTFADNDTVLDRLADEIGGEVSNNTKAFGRKSATLDLDGKKALVWFDPIDKCNRFFVEIADQPVSYHGSVAIPFGGHASTLFRMLSGVLDSSVGVLTEANEIITGVRALVKATGLDCDADGRKVRVNRPIDLLNNRSECEMVLQVVICPESRSPIRREEMLAFSRHDENDWEVLEEDAMGNTSQICRGRIDAVIRETERAISRFVDEAHMDAQEWEEQLNGGYAEMEDDD